MSVAISSSSVCNFILFLFDLGHVITKKITGISLAPKMSLISTTCTPPASAIHFLKKKKTGTKKKNPTKLCARSGMTLRVRKQIKDITRELWRGRGGVLYIYIVYTGIYTYIYWRFDAQQLHLLPLVFDMGHELLLFQRNMLRCQHGILFFPPRPTKKLLLKTPQSASTQMCVLIFFVEKNQHPPKKKKRRWRFSLPRHRTSK